MNVLISTTTNHNCGDDFIRQGCKNILKHVFKTTPNYIHYDRNPNNMIYWPENQNIRMGLQGTFMGNPVDWSKVDLVVLAGSPEFLHHPLAPIYEGLAEHPEIPLLAIGIGYSEPNLVLPLTNYEKEVLNRDETLIITRQFPLAEILAQAFKGTVISVLPCPALFCFESFPEKTRGHLLSDQIAHSLDELTSNQYFSSDPYDMINFIGSHKFVNSKRLHGAIAGISSGAYTTLENDCYRAQSAIELFEEVMQADRGTIQAFKTRILNKYVTLIKSHLCNLTSNQTIQEQIS